MRTKMLNLGVTAWWALNQHSDSIYQPEHVEAARRAEQRDVSEAKRLRNVEADPRVRVSIGARNRAPANARRLNAVDASAALARYAAAHPRAWSGLRSVLEDTLGARIDEHGTDLPMIALDLDAAGASTHRARPPGGSAAPP